MGDDSQQIQQPTHPLLSMEDHKMSYLHSVKLQLKPLSTRVHAKSLGWANYFPTRIRVMIKCTLEIKSLQTEIKDLLLPSSYQLSFIQLKNYTLWQAWCFILEKQR